MCPGLTSRGLEMNRRTRSTKRAAKSKNGMRRGNSLGRIRPCILSGVIVIEARGLAAGARFGN